MNKTEIYYAQLHNTECSYKLHVIEEINSLKNCDKNECQYKRNTYEYKHSKGWLYGSGHCCVLRTFNRLQEYPYMYSYVAHAITAAVFTVAVAAAETASLVTDNLYSSLLTNDNDEETLNINNKTYILATSAPAAASYTYSSFTTTTTPLEAFNISFGNLNDAAIIASTTQSVASLSSTSAVNITADSIQLDVNVSLTSSTSLSSSTDDWSHFYDLVFSWQGVCLIAVFCAFIVITIIGNTLVILAVITTRRLKTVTNCFVMSLAVADLLVGIFVMPPAVAVHLIGSWQLGWVLCDIWISLDVLLCTASILSLCAISVDRYLAVTQPLTYSRKRRSKRLALIMILIVWILALAITCPPILGWYEPGRRDLNECRYNQNEGYVIFSAMGSFFIPMAVMIYVYARISCVIANRHDNMTDISVHNKKFKRYTAADIDNELDADLSEFDIQTTQRTQPPEKTLSNQILAKDLHDIMASDNKISSAMQCHSLLVLQQQTTNSPNSKNGCYEMKRSDSLKRSSTASSVTTTMTSTTCTGTAGVAMDNPWTFTPTNNQQQQQQHHTHYQQHAHPNKQMRTHSVRHQHSTGAGHVTPSPGHNITPDAIITESGASILRSNIPQLRSHQHSHHYTTKSLSNRISSLKKETKTTQTLSIVVGGFIACWLPFFINYLITPFLDEDQVSSTLAKVLTWLGWFNSAINPFIYAFYSVDFRAAFWRLTCKRFFSSTTKPQFPTNTMSIRR